MQSASFTNRWQTKTVVVYKTVQLIGAYLQLVECVNLEAMYIVVKLSLPARRQQKGGEESCKQSNTRDIIKGSRRGAPGRDSSKRQPSGQTAPPSSPPNVQVIVKGRGAGRGTERRKTHRFQPDSLPDAGGGSVEDSAGTPGGVDALLPHRVVRKLCTTVQGMVMRLVMPCITAECNA